MGILGNLGDGATNSLNGILDTLKNPFGNKGPSKFDADFVDGFKIFEYIDGVENGETIVLKGNMLPFVPFIFGGEQKVVKDYYPGNSEPVVQVLGARESDVVIKGRLKAKRFDSSGTSAPGPTNMYHAPEMFQRQLDAFRIRGNLLRLQLGEWQRYGFLEKTKFDMSQVSRIDYELHFVIVGVNKPLNGYFVDRTTVLPFDINKDLILQASFIKEPAVPPMPKTLAGEINALTSDMAKAIGVVTNFVDTTLKTVEDVEGSLHRAIGLVKNARTSISVFKRRIRTIFLNAERLGSVGSDLTGLISDSKRAAQINVNALRNGSYILGTMSATNQLQAILAKMQAQLEALSKKAPKARYVVKDKDTLQKISTKFYGTPDSWNAIYDHNKLTSTLLVTGKLLEIPKI